MKPRLREFDAREPAGRGISSELDGLVDEMLAAFTLAERMEFARLMKDPEYGKAYESGYERGKRDGLDAAFSAWINNTKEMLSIIGSAMNPKWLVPAGAMAGEVYTSPVGTPLPPELRRLLEAQLWYQKLAIVATRLGELNKVSFFRGLELLAINVVNAMKESGVAWVRHFFSLNGRPHDQGYWVGHMIGKAIGTVLTLAIEEVVIAGLWLRIVGVRVTGRLEQLGREMNDMKKPLALAEAMEEAAELAGQKGVKALGKTASEGAAESLTRAVRRLPELGPELNQVLQKDALVIIEHARSYKKPGSIAAVRGVKGKIAELLYKFMPEFEETMTRLRKKVRFMEGWEPELHFEPIVTTAAPAASDAQLAITDGLIFAYSQDRKSILVLAVIESKSPSNVRDLVRGRTEWAGQLHSDFERLSELPLFIRGVRYESSQIVISRRDTEWIAVLPKGNSFGSSELKALSTQGLYPTVWDLPETDNALNRLAEMILREVGNP